VTIFSFSAFGHCKMSKCREFESELGDVKADASSTQVVRPIRLLGSGAMDAILIRRRTISSFFMEIIV